MRGIVVRRRLRLWQCAPHRIVQRRDDIAPLVAEFARRPQMVRSHIDQVARLKFRVDPRLPRQRAERARLELPAHRRRPVRLAVPLQRRVFEEMIAVPRIRPPDLRRRIALVGAALGDPPPERIVGVAPAPPVRILAADQPVERIPCVFPHTRAKPLPLDPARRDPGARIVLQRHLLPVRAARHRHQPARTAQPARARGVLGETFVDGQAGALMRAEQLFLAPARARGFDVQRRVIGKGLRELVRPFRPGDQTARIVRGAHIPNGPPESRRARPPASSRSGGT